MLVDVVHAGRSECDLTDAETGFCSSPPDGLSAAVAWAGVSPGYASVLDVWPMTDARGEVSLRKITPRAPVAKTRSIPERLRPLNMSLKTCPEAP